MPVVRGQGDSLSVWNISPTTVWIAQFGGYNVLTKYNDIRVIELNKYWLLIINLLHRPHTLSVLLQYDIAVLTY